VIGVDTTLEALADPKRRGVIELLRRSPRRAGELAHELGVPRPVMSKHLKVLRTTGLIEPRGDEADARARIYCLRREPFVQLRTWLENIERLWSLELASFKAHAEATRSKRR
jgi:DNA-binding transcriptional ArsR family regulator